MKIVFYKCWLLSVVLLIQTVQAQVTPNINSGNPAIPFPQFLDYGPGRQTLASVNAPGVTHAEMEQRTKEAWQLVCNNTSPYPGNVVVSGVQYLYPTAPVHCTCVEGDGYYLLGAALMGDKKYFDGYYMWAHDRGFNGVKRFIDGVVNPYPGASRGLSYSGSYGSGTGVLGGGISGNSATDGDEDLALALLIAYKQWGEKSGVILTNNGWGGKELNYKEEALNYIKAMVDTSVYAPSLPNKKYITGDIGLDGYLKSGDFARELTLWASNGYLGIQSETAGSTEKLFADYIAPAWFRSFRSFLEAENEDQFSISQYKRAEASSDWLMGLHYSKNVKNIPVMGHVVPSAGNDFIFSANGPFAEDFRASWRTIMNYVWHGNPSYTWNPTTHQAEDNKSNTYEYDMGIRFAKFLKNNQSAPWNNPCSGRGDLSPRIIFKGPYTLRDDISEDGVVQTQNFPLNWIHGAGAGSAIVGQDFELMGEMFRQCVIAWDAATGTNLDSRPLYFHEWYRLAGMLTLAGNFHSPINMVAKPNIKVYHKMDKTFAFTGDQLTYTVSYRNYGSLDGAGTVVKFGIPAGFQFVSSTKGSLSGDSVVWNVGVTKGFKTGGLAATMDSMKITVKVGPTASGRFCTSARVSCSNGLGWTSNEYPNNITAVMERNCVDVVKRALRIEKTASRKTVNPTTNGDVVYKIKFENSSDAGWINGGRPGVRLAFAHEDITTPTANAANVLKYRIFHDAAEPYIDYGNYRVSYFMNDPSIKCYAGTAGCTTGWSLQNTIAEGVVPANVKTIHENITPGTNADGSWNQRIVLQFSPQLATITQHLQQYSGITGSYIHEGGTAALRGVWRLFSSNYSNVDWTDDWSWDATKKDGDGGIYYPIGDDYTDPNNLALPINSWHKSACTTTTQIMKKVLVEEWDGYTWRRVFGNGPLPGRDIDNVVIKDTLPAGISFTNFIRESPLGIKATTAAIAGGRTVISWSIPKMQINQKDSIVYTATVAGPCAEKTLVNKAWIQGNSESPISEGDTITVTCNPVTICPTATTLTKTSDKTVYTDGQTVKYTLNYTQTQGSIAKPDLSSATDWTIQSGSGVTFTGGKITLQGGSKVVTTHDYSYGTNTLGNGIEGTIQIAASENDFAIVVRDNIYIRLLSSGGSNPTLVDIYFGTTKLNATSFSIPFFASSMDFRIKLNGPTLSMWLVQTGTEISGAAPITQTVPNKAGAAGVAHGILGNNPYASHTVTSWRAHMDVAYDVEVNDPLPTGITLPTNISAPGAVTANVIRWPLAAGKANPMPYGTTRTLTWEGTFKGCQKVTNVAYVNTKGITGDQLGVCYDINCGNAPACVPPTSVTANPATSAACLGQADTLKATIVAGGTPLTGYRYVWYKGTPPLPANYISVYSDKIFNPVTAADAGTWILRVEDGTAGVSSCYKEASVNLTVNTPPVAPFTTLTQPTCAIPTGSITISDPIGPGLTYSIDSITFQPGTTFAGLVPNTYKVFVKNASGCTSSASVAINAAPGAPAVPVTTLTQPTCTTPTGSISVTAPTGTGFTYSIDGTNFQAGTSFAALTPDTYTVTAKNAAGCASTSSVTINAVPVKPASTLSANLNSYCSLPSGITLTASDAGTGSTYEFFNGSASQGAASATRTISNAAAGSWKVVVSNQSGCSDSSARFTITKKQVPAAQITSANPSSYCPATNGTTLTAANAGQGATYEWFKNTVSTGLPLTSPTITDATAGDYKVRVTLNGCDSTSATVSVIQSANLTLNISGDTSLCTAQSLNLSADQSSGITWTLPDNSTVTTSTISSLNPLTGLYKAVYAGSGGCTGADSVSVSISQNPVATLTPDKNLYCNNENGVTLNVANAGTGALYSWKKDNAVQGNPTAANTLQNALAGNWKVIVTNSAGCTDSSTSVQVTLKPSPVANITTLDPTYCPPANGTRLTAQDAGTNAVYEWIKSPATTGTVSGNVFSNATVGVYTVKVTLDGCDSISQPVEVKQAASISLVISGDTTLCEGDPLNLTANQTTGISWTLPDKSKLNTPDVSLTIPAAGIYKAEFTGQGGCGGTDSVTVIVTPLPVAEIVPGSRTYCAGEAGVNLTAQDAGPTAEYEWFKGITSVGSGISLANATEGDYSVKVTNGTCNKSSAIVTVTQSSALTATISAPQRIYCQGDAGVTLTANTAAPNATYQWIKDESPQGTASAINQLTNAIEGVYKVRVVSGTCSGESDTVSVKASSLIITQLEFDPKTPTDTCLNTELTINAFGTPGTIEWTENGVNKGIHEAYTFTLTQKTVITANLTTTLSCAIPKTTGPKEITINATPVIAPTVVIDRSQATVKNCEGESTRLFMSTSDNAGSNPTYQWYVNGILKGGETDPLGLALENWTNPTIVELEITKNDGCTPPNKKSVKSSPITLNGNANVSVDLQILRINDNTVNGFICKGSRVNLEVVTNLQNPDISYYWRNNDSLNPLTQFGDPVFSHTVDYDITDTISVALSGCYTGNTTVTTFREIKIERPVTVQIKNNLNGIYSEAICEGIANEFTLTVATGNIKSFNWYKNDVLLPDNTNIASISGLVVSDEIKVEAILNVSCAVNASDSVIITDIRQNPKPGFLNVLPINICLGDSVTLTPVETNTTYTWSWLKDNVSTSDFAGPQTVSESGKYTLILENGPCKVSDSIQVTQTIVFVKASAEPLEFILGEEVSLKSSISDPNLTYQWSPVEIMRSPNSQNTIALPMKSGFVKIVVKTADNCFAADSIELKKKDKLFIPNAIVPGNNDQNSFWGITGTENYPNLEIKVYNRWGNLVYEQTGYSKPWDGTRNGVDLPTGTYYYIIKDRSFEAPFVGDLTIVR